MRFIQNVRYAVHRYGYLLSQLVSRDFKVKYKRSVLGVAWSLLYPLLTTAVLAIVFSNIFRFTQPGVSFLAYLMTGLVYFNYFSEASNLSMSSIVANFSLINKVYLPKYIFPLSKCLFVGINFLLTLIPLAAVLLFTRSGFSWHLVLLPYSFLCLFLFTLGMSLFLAAISVFMRDMFYIYGVLISLWTYATPIMYDLAIIDNPVLTAVMKFNPLYQFINFGRVVMLYHKVPSAESFIGCAISAVFMIVVGVVVFRKTQDQFIYYM